MAALHSFRFHPSIFLCLVASFCFNQTCFGFKAKHLNLTAFRTHWSWAGATWYGSPDGAGSDGTQCAETESGYFLSDLCENDKVCGHVVGGACGYGNAVSQPPFSSMVTGIGPSLYKSGKECGACYKIKCTKRMHPSCSGKPARVVITDFCPGGPCVTDSVHFDLSGTAFGAMAKAGEEVKLRDAGVLKIRYARVACNYSGRTIAFHVDQGSNSNYFVVVIEYEEGDGDLAGVSLKEAPTGSAEWRSMQQSWGAVWKLDAGSEMQPPFSIQLTSQYSRETIVAKNVIPENWKPGSTYRSLVNYL